MIAFVLVYPRKVVTAIFLDIKAFQIHRTYSNSHRPPHGHLDAGQAQAALRVLEQFGIECFDLRIDEYQPTIAIQHGGVSSHK